MKEKRLIRYFILLQWTFFGLLSVVDKIIPDVYPLWVGADFYTLFVKLFSSLGLKDPMIATVALAGIAILEIIAFACYLFSLVNMYRGSDRVSEQWFYRGIAFSVLLFSLFSIGDQVFGDRFTLLEHSIFWIILIVSWAIFKYSKHTDERVISFAGTKGLKTGLLIGTLLTVVAAYSIVDFSGDTFASKSAPVQGVEVVEGMYKFDLPFLGDKITMENTIATFEKENPDLKINYMYTGPSELNAKKKTHMLLYVFVEDK